MRILFALAVLTAVLAAGCAPSPGDDVVSDEGGGMPASRETVESEPESDGTASLIEPTESGTSREDAAIDEPAEEAGDVTVAIGDFFFEPDGLTVEEGDTVTWTHDGDITHNVTARDGSFASENLASGEVFVHTFTAAGNFEYRCTLHGQMLGSIDVA